ncbi:MAG: AEC family transporter [Pseudomonadota bacterium]
MTRLGQPFDTKFTTSVVMNVGMPALIITHLSEQHVAFDELLTMMSAVLVAITLFGVLAAILLKLCKLSLRTYLGAFMFANVGNVGLPSVQLAFGDDGLALAFGSQIVVIVGLLTVGTWLPQKKLTLKRLVTSPLIYSVVVGLYLMATETRLPHVVDAPLDILAGMTIPLMLLSLGHAMAELQPAGVVRGFLLSLAHLAIVVPVAALTISLFDLQGLLRGVFIVQSIMPVSVFAYLLAQQYQPSRAPEVASFVLCSTLLTVVVLPLVLTYWV